MKKKERKFVVIEAGQNPLLLSDGTKLEWVPRWGCHLAYCPDDLKNDRPLRFWHVFRHRQMGFKRVRVELTRTVDYFPVLSRRYLTPRMKICFKIEGKDYFLRSSQLTQLCRDGFPPANPRKSVVDHLNRNTLDDRPSNLELKPQRENSLRSEKFRAAIMLSPAERHRRRQLKNIIARREKRKLMAIIDPDDCNTFALEFEFSQRVADGTIDLDKILDNLTPEQLEDIESELEREKKTHPRPLP